MEEKRLIIATILILLVAFLSYTPVHTGYYSIESSSILPARYDVDKNGVIDGKDKEAVEKALQGWDSHYDHTDITLDGKTDEKDLEALEAYFSNT